MFLCSIFSASLQDRQKFSVLEISARVLRTTVQGKKNAMYILFSSIGVKFYAKQQVLSTVQCYCSVPFDVIYNV